LVVALEHFQPPLYGFQHFLEWAMWRALSSSHAPTRLNENFHAHHKRHEFITTSPKLLQVQCLGEQKICKSGHILLNLDIQTEDVWSIGVEGASVVASVTGELVANGALLSHPWSEGRRICSATSQSGGVGEGVSKRLGIKMTGVDAAGQGGMVEKNGVV
jgi:hypothetical protein